MLLIRGMVANWHGETAGSPGHGGQGDRTLSLALRSIMHSRPNGYLYAESPTAELTRGSEFVGQIL